VELHGRQLSLMVRRSVAATNWLQHKEPRAARPICDLMLERLSKAEAEMSQLLEGSAPRGAGTGADRAAKGERSPLALPSPPLCCAQRLARSRTCRLCGLLPAACCLLPPRGGS
jgi:hypothetical protein